MTLNITPGNTVTYQGRIRCVRAVKGTRADIGIGIRVNVLDLTPVNEVPTRIEAAEYAIETVYWGDDLYSVRVRNAETGNTYDSLTRKRVGKYETLQLMSLIVTWFDMGRSLGALWAGMRDVPDLGDGEPAGTAATAATAGTAGTPASEPTATAATAGTPASEPTATAATAGTAATAATGQPRFSIGWVPCPRAARQTIPTDQMTPIDPKSRIYYDTFVGGRIRRECWGATSIDREWGYTRVEDTGTPWVATHLRTGRTTRFYGSLAKARRATSSGAALRDLEESQ